MPAIWVSACSEVLHYRLGVNLTIQSLQTKYQSQSQYVQGTKVCRACLESGLQSPVFWHLSGSLHCVKALTAQQCQGHLMHNCYSQP